MKQRILDIISHLQQEREQAHIVPPHVLTTEIIIRGCSNPYAALNSLVQEGKLHWHRTLNDTAFTISKEPPPSK